MLASVIIPWHGGLDGIAELRAAVDSALAQQGVEIEVIVVANGVADDAFAALAALADNPRVRVVRLEAPSASLARNHGMALARGELLFFLDADDTFLPGRLLVFATAYRKEPFDIAFSRGWRDRGDGAGWPMPAKAWDGQTPIAEYFFCAGNNISASALVMAATARRHLKFNHMASPYEDPDLLIEAEAKGLRIRMLADVLYVWNDARAHNRLSRAVNVEARLTWAETLPGNVSPRARAAFRARCIAQHTLAARPVQSLSLIWDGWRKGGVELPEAVMFVLRGLLPRALSRRLADAYLARRARRSWRRLTPPLGPAGRTPGPS